MCLSLTGRVVSVDGETATVDLHGRCIAASRLLEPGVSADDWVTVGAGWIVARLSPNEAARQIALERALSDTTASGDDR